MNGHSDYLGAAQFFMQILWKQSYLWRAFNFLLSCGCTTDRLNSPMYCPAKEGVKRQHTTAKYLSRAMPDAFYLWMLGNLNCHFYSQSEMCCQTIPQCLSQSGDSSWIIQSLSKYFGHWLIQINYSVISKSQNVTHI